MSLWRPPHSVLGCGTHAHMMPWGVLPGWLRLGHTLNGLNQLAAAAAAKSLQLCPTLCNPIDGNPPGSPIPGILQARTLEWVAISFSDA